MKKYLLLNGPNLDMLGIREPGVYGSQTLKKLEKRVRKHGKKRGVEVDCFQSNSESELVELIHEARKTYAGIVYNPGAHTHYSYALRDALGSIDVPCVEVHISNVDAREPFRAVSVIAPACVAQVKGRGFQGYCDALDLLIAGLNERLGEGYADRATHGEVVVPAGAAAVAEAAGVADARAPEPAVADAEGEDAACCADAEPAGEPLQEGASGELEAAFADEPADVEQPAAETPKAATQLPASVSAVLEGFDLTLAWAACSQQDAAPSADEPVAAARVEAFSPASVEPFAPAASEAEEPALSVDLPQEEPALPVDQPRMEEPACPAVLPQPDAAALDDPEAQSRRLGALRAVLAEQGADAMLVRSTSNVAWLTAFDDVFDDEAAHGLLVTGSAAVLHTDSRYESAARSAAARAEGVSVSVERTSHGAFAVRSVAPAAASASLFKRTKPAALAIEDSMTLAEFRALRSEVAKQKAPLKLKETSQAVLRLRAVKSRSEVARMRAAQAITDAAFAHIVGFMRPGMTEREVQRELEDFMLRQGAQGLAFSSIVAAGAHAASPHAIAGDTRLESGMCVVLDFGARAFGYCSDMTRTVFLGDPAPRLRSAYQTIRQANEAVEAALRPGVTGKAMHELAESVLESGGFGGAMGHGLGHGVGIDVHELPNLSPRNPDALVAGNVVTVEPGIYQEGEFGMRLEDFGVVTDEGFEVFTASPHDPVVL
nr:type II 3-dehydroquinate dehydratase [Xiamenia xianingshaonis]